MNCVVDVVVVYFEDFFFGIEYEFVVNFFFIEFVDDYCIVFVMLFGENVV